jgi:tRNA pseudouridine38-40 synthase
MSAAARALLGEHDFTTFRASGCDAKSPIRIIRRLDVVRAGDIVEIHAEATAFLRNMVRIIAGTLAEVGLGRRPVESVAAALASGDRGQAGRTAPPQGLTLEEVFY